MPVLTKINTNSIADDAITAEKYSLEASGYVANTTNQNISGTYSDNRMYTSDAYTLSANATVNGNLTLSSVKPTADVVLTAGGAYTLTGTGVLSGGSLLAKANTDLTGMTGTIGSTVINNMPRNEGLVVKKGNDYSTVDIEADFLTVFNTDNGGKVLSSINLTADINASGVNGLDTGSEAAIWYHIWVIYNGTTIASLLSASADSPTMPSGYTYKKYVGAVYNPSSNFRNFHQVGNTVHTTELAAGTFTQAAWRVLDLATFVPSTASLVSGIAYTNNTSGTNSGYSYMSSDPSGNIGQIYTRIMSSSGSTTSVWSPYRLMITTSQTIFVYDDTDSVVVHVSGWGYSNIV